ncbi:MAG: exonuclease SbcC, partial [Acidimicrobiales bacterium]|nr:exonuclease SbcC [Acidimicrobiales bacterium]
EVRAAAAALQLLDGVAVPAGLADHAAALIDARDQATVADADAEQTADAADAADAVLAQMPPRVALEAALRDHVARQRQRAEQARLAASLVETEAAVLSAASVAAEADAGLRAATEAVEAARWEHRAHDLAGSLVAGEPCPVCRQVVSEVPIDATPADLDAAGEAQRAADTAASGARRALEAATRERDRTQATVEAAAGRLAEIDTALAAWPDAELVSATLAEVTAAEDVARHARDAAAKARRTAVATRRACQEAEGQEAEARRAFDAARDRLASLDPPPAARDDIAGDWAALAEWAESRRPDHAASGAAATARATAAEQDREALVGRLTAAAAGVGVRPARAGDLRGPVADALAQAAAERERIDRARVEAIEHRDSASAAQRDADVAKELARLLNANHFEKWMLDEALAVLVEGATELLLDLSDGAYSLGLDERSNFLVVDHRNADEVRPARTLSGGETFLASLALALALADQIGSLAAGGAAHLESIFLDEGFGSLDPATLDTVATAIEELGSRDRMVGLISHVAELAERVPVRFEVAPGPAGSTITKVVA